MRRARNRKPAKRWYDHVEWLEPISTRTGLPATVPAPKLEAQKGWATGKRSGQPAVPRDDAALRRAAENGFDRKDRD